MSVPYLVHMPSGLGILQHLIILVDSSKDDLLVFTANCSVRNNITAE